MENRLTLKMLEETVLGLNTRIYISADIILSTGRYLFSYEDIPLKICRHDDNLTFSIYMYLTGKDLYPFGANELQIKENYSSEDTVFYFNNDCIKFKADKNSFIIKI